jgi:hypothetical protein
MVNQVMMLLKTSSSDERCWERIIKEDVFCVRRKGKPMGTALRKSNNEAGHVRLSQEKDRLAEVLMMN